jgi:hypothetical protein
MRDPVLGGGIGPGFGAAWGPGPPNGPEMVKRPRDKRGLAPGEQ